MHFWLCVVRCIQKHLVEAADKQSNNDGVDDENVKHDKDDKNEQHSAGKENKV